KAAELIDESTVPQKDFHAKWERFNRLWLMVMKMTIFEHLFGGLPDTNNAREFFTAIGQRYQLSSTFETRSLISELTCMRYDGMGCVREYILKLVSLKSKL
ncbi:hypothetical protein CFOL_v3_17809, partial [Cephalotus follicularis]